jgi:hypothetical protein
MKWTIIKGLKTSSTFEGSWNLNIEHHLVIDKQ